MVGDMHRHASTRANTHPSEYTADAKTFMGDKAKRTQDTSAMRREFKTKRVR